MGLLCSRPVVLGKQLCVPCPTPDPRVGIQSAVPWASGRGGTARTPYTFQSLRCSELLLLSDLLVRAQKIQPGYHNPEKIAFTTPQSPSKVRVVATAKGLVQKRYYCLKPTSDRPLAALGARSGRVKLKIGGVWENLSGYSG